MLKKISIFSLLLAFIFPLKAIDVDAINAENTTADENICEEKIINIQLLDSVFNKLIKLEEKREGKVNIVHIGDSHIQADIFTNAVRQPLQEKFGNGGYGFTFPYNLAKAYSGTKFFQFTSNTAWRSCRNNQPFKCDPDTEFGLGGYGFTTRSKNFVISMNVNAEQYYFNTLKVITPYEQSCFKVATAEGNPVIRSVQSSVKQHKIKSGETLSGIASKYNVSIAAIKKENNLKSNNIYAGKTLRIPVTTTETKVDMSLFHPLAYEEEKNFVSTFYSEIPVSKIYFIPANNTTLYNLNGLVLENDNPGVIYHSLGVVGSKASDFNATPLFFEQLPLLNPDLIILSFGTNESFGRIPPTDFIAQMQLLIDNINLACPEAAIIVITQPTSLFRRKALNTFASEYSAHLMQKEDCALWDLYSFTGGIMGARHPLQCQIASDNVHYTEQGYIKQGSAFVYDFLAAYEQYKQNKKNENQGDEAASSPGMPEQEVQEIITEETFKTE